MLPLPTTTATDQLTLYSREEFHADPAGAYLGLEYLTFKASQLFGMALAKRLSSEIGRLSIAELAQLLPKVDASLKSRNYVRRLEQSKSTANISIASTIEKIDRDYIASLREVG